MNAQTLYETYAKPKKIRSVFTIQGNKIKGPHKRMIIRDYQTKDLESLTELMSDLGHPSNIENMKNRMEQIQSNPMYFTFVAEMDGIIVGMVGVRKLFSYEVDDVVTQISALVTKKEFRNRGIGKSLIKYVEEWAVKERSELIVLTSGIKEERIMSHEFYKSIGFDITGYRFVKKIIKGGL